MSSIIDRLEKFANSASSWLNWVAGIGIVGMLALTVADILAVKFFRWPIPGAIEIVAFSGVIVYGFAIAYTQVLRGHIRVEFLVMHLPKLAQSIIHAFVCFFGLALFALLAWKSVDYGLNLQRTGEVSMTQGIPLYPFAFAIAFCCLPVCLLLLVELIRSVERAVEK